MNKKNDLDLANLDQIMDLVGELLINKSRLETLEALKEEGRDVLSQLDRITGELHDKVMKVRMVPLANIFQKFDQGKALILVCWQLELQYLLNSDED